MMNHGRLERHLKLKEPNLMRIKLLLVLMEAYLICHLVISTRGQQLPFGKVICGLWNWNVPSGMVEYLNIISYLLYTKETV